jgi:murein DD-endopeptidase MepM/ murein hydrolase activator NlpD
MLGGVLTLAVLVAANVFISDVTNQTKDILHAIEKKELLDKRFIGNSEDDYDIKLMELQARLDEAQRNLSQLDVLRTQPMKSNGQLNVANNVVDLGNVQGGPINPATAVINLGNQGEQYGARLDRTIQDSVLLSNRVEELQKSLTNTWESSNSVPTGSPLPLMPQASSRLGYRLDPITQKVAWHDGTDFPAAYGTPILATAEGVVSRATWDEDYGYVVDIQHKSGVVTRYGHAEVLLVKAGDFVTQGQVIAKVGSSGRSTGPHLHYEVLRNGQSLAKN